MKKLAVKYCLSLLAAVPLYAVGYLIVVRVYGFPEWFGAWSWGALSAATVVPFAFMFWSERRDLEEELGRQRLPTTGPIVTAAAGTVVSVIGTTLVIRTGFGLVSGGLMTTGAVVILFAVRWIARVSSPGSGARSTESTGQRG